MRKVLLKDLAEFRQWQYSAVKGVDDAGQQAVSLMAPPVQYPVILVWSFTEQQDTNCEYGRFPNAFIDKFDHKYIYIGEFPVKHLKQGTYAYQIFQTSDYVDDIV